MGKWIWIGVSVLGGAIAGLMVGGRFQEGLNLALAASTFGAALAAGALLAGSDEWGNRDRSFWFVVLLQISPLLYGIAVMGLIMCVAGILGI